MIIKIQGLDELNSTNCPWPLGWGLFIVLLGKQPNALIITMPLPGLRTANSAMS